MLQSGTILLNGVLNDDNTICIVSLIKEYVSI